MNLEYIHITVVYGCGHEMLRPVRRDDEHKLSFVDMDTRSWTVGAYCWICNAKVKRMFERKMEKAGKL